MMSNLKEANYYRFNEYLDLHGLHSVSGKILTPQCNMLEFSEEEGDCKLRKPYAIKYSFVGNKNQNVYYISTGFKS